MPGIKHFREGDEIEEVLTLTYCEVKHTKKDVPFLKTKWTDSTGVITGILWGDREAGVEIPDDLADQLPIGADYLVSARVESWEREKSGGRQTGLTLRIYTIGMDERDHEGYLDGDEDEAPEGWQKAEEPDMETQTDDVQPVDDRIIAEYVTHIADENLRNMCISAVYEIDRLPAEFSKMDYHLEEVEVLCAILSACNVASNNITSEEYGYLIAAAVCYGLGIPICKVIPDSKSSVIGFEDSEMGKLIDVPEMSCFRLRAMAGEFDISTSDIAPVLSIILYGSRADEHEVMGSKLIDIFYRAMRLSQVA